MGDDDDSDDDDSGDSDDDDSDDTSDDDSDDDDSNDDSDTDSSDETTVNTDTNTDTNSFVDPCVGLTQSQCNGMYDSKGNALCATNVQTENCYAVVASQGMYGSGNYDTGYNAAQQEAQKDTQQLNTIVGVLAGIIAVMALGIIGGAYYLHTRTKKMEQMAHENVAMETIQSQTHDYDHESEVMLDA